MKQLDDGQQAQINQEMNIQELQEQAKQQLIEQQEKLAQKKPKGIAARMEQQLQMEENIQNTQNVINAL